MCKKHCQHKLESERLAEENKILLERVKMLEKYLYFIEEDLIN